MKHSKTTFTFLILIFISGTILSCTSTKRINKKQLSKSSLSVVEERQFNYFFEEALRERFLDHYDNSIELLTKCYHINSNDACLMYEFSNIYALMGKIDFAINYLSTAISLDRENLWYKVNLANLYIATGDLKTATDIYEFAAQKHPERDDINYNLAELYLKQNRFTDAIDILNKIEKKQGITEDVSFEKYRIYSNIGENKKATKEIDLLINRFPQEMKYKILKGNIYLENNEREKAFALYKYVLEKEPENGLARLSMAEYYDKVNEKGNAMLEMEYALKSQNIEIETKLGILNQYLNQLQNKKDWQEKMPRLFDTLLEIHPNIIDIHYYYASNLSILERYDDAVKQYEIIVGIDPKHLQSWGEMIDIKLKQGKMEDLVDITNKAILNLPEYPQWFFYQGIAYFQLKKYDEAISTLEKGLLLVKPDNASLKSDFYGQIADTYMEKGEKEISFGFYDKSIESNPLNSNVLNNYSYYLSVEKKDLAKAEAMIKKCMELSPNNSTVLDTYAWVLFQQGYYNLAKKYIEEALKYNGNKSDVIIEHYGDILDKTNNKEEALKMWQKSLEMGNKSGTLLLKIEKKEYIE